MIQILGSNEGDINVYGEIYYDNANGHIYARLTNPFIWTLLPPFDLGSFRDFFSEISLEYFETNTPTLTTDNGELVIGLQTKAGIILIADQFRESGVRTANSTIGQWNGSSFTEHTVPKVFNLTKNSQQAIRASFDILQNPVEKFYRWNDDNNELNILKTFSANGSLSRLNSKFRPHKTNVTMNAIVEGVSANDKPNFKDPWENYFYNSSYGISHNQGMNASFKPFNSSSSTYKGVFLDIGGLPPNIQPPYYSVKAPDNTYVLNWTGTNVAFQNPTAQETPVVFTNDHATITANVKGSLISNSSSAFSSTSQRKFYKSFYGVINLVYESMGKVWYERSTDNGTTWQLCNNGQPLSTNPSKLPSLAQGVSNHGVVIVFQEQTSNGYNIIIKEFDAGVQVGSSIVHESYAQPYSENANPVVQNVLGYLMVVWEADADGGIFDPNGLYYKFGLLNANHQFNFSVGDVIAGTSASSNMSALSGSGGYDTLRFALAYEQNNAIYYRSLKIPYSSQNIIVTNPVNLSMGNGYTHNYAPSIIAVGSGARVTWIGKRYIYEEELLKSQSGGGHWEYRTIFRDADATGPFWNFGSNVTAATINRGLQNGGYSVNAYVVGWSQSTGVPNQYTRHSTLSQIINIKDASGNLVPGGFLQFTEAVAPTTAEVFQQMPSITFNSTPVLKTFKLSKTVAQLGKESFSLAIATGREGVISIDSGSFYFAFGDISVNEEKIGFEEIADTTRLDSLTSILRYLESQPFVLNNSSQFFYGVQYGFTDSINSLSSLSENDFIKFKIELIDNTSQQIIGTFDNITYNNSNVYQHQNLAYQVNTTGIGSREVKLRLKIEVSRYTTAVLSNKFADHSVLGLEKENMSRKKISYQGTLAVTNYELSQNYPNPFNPTTTINFALPKADHVTLMVYDVLGKEVTTLVNDYKESGRYSVEFNASKLSSGVYIYKLTSGKYNEVKKLMLLK